MTRKKSLDDVHMYIRDEDYENAVSVLREGMVATHVVRQSKESGERGVDYKEVIDHGTRIQSAKLMLEYGFGKPATRQEINITDDSRLHASPADVMHRLMDSSADLSNILNIYSGAVQEITEKPLIIEENG
jgi:hypothetical protein